MVGLVFCDQAVAMERARGAQLTLDKRQRPNSWGPFATGTEQMRFWISIDTLIGSLAWSVCFRTVPFGAFVET